jgi:hypothetical protein
MRFGGGLCPPKNGDGNPIHQRRERECTNRPRPHHDPCGVSAASQQPFLGAPVNLIDIAMDSRRLRSSGRTIHLDGATPHFGSVSVYSTTTSMVTWVGGALRKPT